jgi:hypothetical protein
MLCCFFWQINGLVNPLAVKINDKERILEDVFNLRITDASDWNDIIDDIEFVMNHPNEHAYNPDGSFYRGKYNIEGWYYDDNYNLSVSYNSYYAIVNSNRDFTQIGSDRPMLNKYLEVHVPTSQMLVLIKKWRDFLLSGKEEETGEIEIDFLKYLYYDRNNNEED